MFWNKAYAIFQYVYDIIDIVLIITRRSGMFSGFLRLRLRNWNWYKM